MKNDKRFPAFRAIHERPLSLSFASNKNAERGKKKIKRRSVMNRRTDKVSWAWEAWVYTNADSLPSSKRNHHPLKGMRIIFASIVLVYVRHDHTWIWWDTITERERKRERKREKENFKWYAAEHLREGSSVSRGCNARKNKVYKSPLRG